MNELHENSLGHEQEPKSLVLARALESTVDPEEIKQTLRLLLESVGHDLGKEFTADVAGIYRNMKDENCLVRVEGLSRVLEALELEKPLHISDANESHYANAVVPLAEGFKIAYSEGQAPGPVRTVVAFGKTIIGFKTERLLVQEIDFNESELRDARERKYLCRHVSGTLQKEDIRQLVMRIPFALMPDEFLTKAESSKPSTFVFRGIQF